MRPFNNGIPWMHLSLLSAGALFPAPVFWAPFQKPFQAFHHFGSVAFPFCDGNLAFQALDWVRSVGGQCLPYFFANGAEFFCADHSLDLS